MIIKKIYEEIWREKYIIFWWNPPICALWCIWWLELIACVINLPGHLCRFFKKKFSFLSCKINLLSTIELLRKNMLFTSLIAGECMMYIKRTFYCHIDLLNASNTRKVPFREKEIFFYCTEKVMKYTGWVNFKKKWKKGKKMFASTEDWTQDPWFTRPVLYHWATEAHETQLFLLCNQSEKWLW